MLNRNSITSILSASVLRDPKLFLALFFVFNLVLLLLSTTTSIGDFGNYYYGSKLWVEGKNTMGLYTDIHWFNEQIKLYGETNYFENYIPVPPFSLIFYLPFTLLKAHTAKFVFNTLSLIIFCFSLRRLMKQLNYFETSFHFLFLIFLYPLLRNYQLGQSYLIVSSLCIEFYLANERHNKKTAGLIIALLFSLKLFPVFLAVVFLIKRDWKSVLWSVLFILLLQGSVLIALGQEVMFHYYGDILPRLFMNEVTDPFSSRNQSIHSFLLREFIAEPSLNPYPLLHAPLLASVIQWMVYTLLLTSIIISVLKQNALKAFAVLLVGMILTNKYTTVYGLVALMPLVFLSREVPKLKYLLLTGMLFLVCNLPVQQLNHMTPVFQFLRLWLEIGIFILIAGEWNWRYFFMSLPLAALPSAVFFKYTTNSAMELKRETGILYDFKVMGDSLQLFICRGDTDELKYLEYPIKQIDSVNLSIQNSRVLLKGVELYTSHGQVKKALLFNNSELIMMSDENRAVGQFTLLMKHIGNIITADHEK